VVCNLLDLLGVAVLWKILAKLTEEVFDAVGSLSFVENVCSAFPEFLVILLRIKVDGFLDKLLIVTVVSEKLVSSTLLLGFLHSLTNLGLGLAGGVNLGRLNDDTKLLLPLLKLLVIVNLVLCLDPAILLSLLHLFLALLLLLLLDLLRVDIILIIELLLLLFLLLLLLLVFLVVAV